MAIYINGIGNVSPQNTWDNNKFLEEIVEYEGNQLRCVEPNFKEYINPVRLRRMSRVIKTGLASGFIALKDAGIENPGAVITGTGFGCVEDTEKFLFAVIDNGEQQLTPTAFMQSTHNTISGQIAINLNCKNYNSTYVHRGASFVKALQDGMMLIEENNADNVLVGGFDECTDEHYIVMGRVGRWKKELIKNTDLLNNTATKGSVAGEGAQFFVLSNKRGDKSYAQLKGIDTFYKPETKDEVEQKINQFLSFNNLSIADVDLVIMGNNGDVEGDTIYKNLSLNLFKNTQQAYFKHLSGQYDTSDAFGGWLAVKILHHQSIPTITKLNDLISNDINNVLVYNHYYNKYHNLQLYCKC